MSKTSSKATPDNVSNFIELLRYRAIHQPNQIAYTFLKNGKNQETDSLTYYELDKQARIIAAQLQSIGAVGGRALLLYPPGLEYIAAFFGCLYAGVVAVPLYPPHPARIERTLPRLKAITKDAQPSVALTTLSILSMAKLVLSRTPEFRNVRWVATDNDSGKLTTRILRMLFSSPKLEKGDSGATWQEPSLNDDSLAFLQYTSGSTGTPKGVMVTHGNLMYNSELIHQCAKHTPESYGVSWLPPYHDMGLIGGILQPLYGGFPCTLMSPISFLQRPLIWLETISRYKGTSSAGPNFAFDLCVRKVTPEVRETLDLSSWEIAFNGAEPVRPDTLERFTKTFESCGFRREVFYPCYGLAEGTLIVSGGGIDALPVLKNIYENALGKHRVDFSTAEPDTGNERKIRHLIGCGNTLEEQQIVIVNPETLIRCQEDEVGEIWVSGKSVAQGYWRNPEATKETFQAYLKDTGEGPFLRTGDMGFLCNGELFVTGRIKDLIIIRGRNHYPQDIELTVERSYPRMRPGSSAAFSVEIEGEERLVIVAEAERRYKTRRGQSDKAIYKGLERRNGKNRRQFIELPEYIPDDRSPLNVGTAINAIRSAVAENHELQAYAVMLIKVGSIPKTSSGKIQRYACKEKFLNKTLDTLESSILENNEMTVEENISDEQLATLLSDVREDRQGSLESYLRHLVSTLLKTSPSQIDMQQPLTSMGLDSMMAIELQHHIETGVGFAFPMTRFLEGANIRQLATEIREHLEFKSQESEDRIQESGVRSQAPEAKSQQPTANSQFPLSYNQQSLWFMYQLAPESAAYNLFFPVRIISDVDIPGLRCAFQTLVSRHPSLRTTYTVQNGLPVQQVQEDATVCFEEIDASEWNKDEFKTRLTAEAHRSFDLKNGPVIRVTLYTRSADERILLLNIHHIAIDLWSFSVMLDELRMLYESGNLKLETDDADSRSQISNFKPQISNYANYVRWQEEMLRSDKGEQLWNYWHKQLGGELPVLNLPTDHPRPPVQTYTGASYNFKLDKELTGKIRKLARDSNATLYMILLAAFQVLLYRYTGQDDILVGAPSAGRSKAEFDRVLGYFVNPVVIRSDMTGEPSFSAFLKKVRQTALDALAHQDYPFQLLVKQLQPTRDPSRSPLFQVMFALQKPYRVQESAAFVMGDTDARISLGGLELESFPVAQQMSQFDLTLMMAEVQDELSAALEYNTDLFDKTTIIRMAGHFQTLLQGIVANPDQSISELPLMNKTELHQVVAGWNDTQMAYPRDKTVVDLFEERVEKTPDNVAVVFEDTQLSYRELNEKANQIAYFLREAYQVQPDDRVGILMNRSEQVIVGIMGILKAGGAYVPMDPEYPRDRIQHIISDSSCKVVLSEQKIFESLEIDAKFADILGIRHENTANPERFASPHHLAYVIYTSGSTGIPKGVMIEHYSVVNLICGHQQILYNRFGEGMHQLLTAPFVFDVSVAQIFVSLVQQNPLYVANDDILYNPSLFTRFLYKENIHFIDVTPGFLSSLLETSVANDLPETVRHINLGAEKLPPSLIERFYEYNTYRNITLANIYGPTESCVDAIWFQINSDCFLDYGVLPIGKPRPNIQVFILDAFLNPVPIGIPGEICLAGDGLARGYLNNEDLTKEKFIEWNPSLNSKFQIPNSKFPIRVYRTGDLARWLPDGNIEFLGRNDDQVKIRGYRIELGEIENQLLSCPAVRDAAVIAKAFRNQNKELAAYVTGDEKLNISELRNHLKSKLPDYMIPSYFIPLEKLPLTPSGKTNYRALPVPESLRPELDTVYVKPQNDIEQSVATIWQEVLQIEKVGIHDNFFDLGGHSLLLIQVQNKLQGIFGRDIPVVNLFRYPTIAALAQYLSQSDDAEQEVSAVSQQIHDRAQKQRKAMRQRKQFRTKRN